MKFMLKWRVHPEKRHDVLKGFSQMDASADQADMGDKIKLIGRWHDVARFEGVAIYESSDALAMSQWALNWNNVLDAEVTPVLDDDEVREVGKNRFG
jgi:hypothetical protein